MTLKSTPVWFSMDKIARYVESKPVCKEDFTEAMLSYTAYLNNEKVTDSALIAFKIHNDRIQKEIIEALILSECPVEDVVQIFKVPKKSLQIYSELFFDLNNFKTNLDKISYLENYQDVFGKELKLRAVNLGYEYVLYTYGNIVPKTSSQKVLVQRMFMSSAYKAMNMNYYGITSAVTKQAVEHAKLMLKAYEALEKMSLEKTEYESDFIKILLHSEDNKNKAISASEII